MLHSVNRKGFTASTDLVSVKDGVGFLGRFSVRLADRETIV
jgi:hypothetical protein